MVYLWEALEYTVHYTVYTIHYMHMMLWLHKATAWQKQEKDRTKLMTFIFIKLNSIKHFRYQQGPQSWHLNHRST